MKTAADIEALEKKLSEEKAKAQFAGCVLAFAMLPVTMVMRGFVLTKLWLWFVVSTFHLPALSILQALGLALFFSLFTGVRPKKADPDVNMLNEAMATLGYGVGGYGLVLLLGYILKAMM